MFGSAKLDTDAIKCCAENDFCLPETPCELEEKLCTCVRTLELLTKRDRTAIEGFRHGMDVIQRDRRLFKNFLASDHLFAVKFACLFDRVFQNSVCKLGHFCDKRKPIQRAQKSPEHLQTQVTEKAMISYKVSAILRLFLPSSLRSEPKVGSEGKEKPCSKSKATPADKNEPAGKVTNPNAAQTWNPPQGKNCRDCFDSRDPEGKEMSPAGRNDRQHQKKDHQQSIQSALCMTREPGRGTT
jgi:hypothetical protein